ncbi:MAG: hypothetical protein COB76_01135 [Alphaproteobacteria bacterium]|nr:MAG: hypothetical protein COB76_01135 [Alphaproteobacteria bacterium]
MYVCGMTNNQDLSLRVKFNNFMRWRIEDARDFLEDSFPFYNDVSDFLNRKRIIHFNIESGANTLDLKLYSPKLVHKDTWQILMLHHSGQREMSMTEAEKLHLTLLVWYCDLYDSKLSVNEILPQMMCCNIPEKHQTALENDGMMKFTGRLEQNMHGAAEKQRILPLKIPNR